MTAVLELLDTPSRPDASGVDLSWVRALEQSLSGDLDSWVDAVAHDGALGEDRAWRLLNFPEQAASLLVRERRHELVELSAVAFSLLEAGPLDRRDEQVVAALVRRGCALAGLDFTAGVAAGCGRVGDLGQRCKEWLWWVSDSVTATHVEVGEGADFRFQRIKSGIDLEALERWAKGEG